MSNPTDLAATYAALILADADVEVTASKILALTTAANIELEPIWATLLAKALEGKNIKDMLSSVGVGATPTAGAAGAVQGNVKPQAEKDKDKAPKTEPDEDSDEDLFGGGLFD